MFSDFSSFSMYPQHTSLTEQSSLSSRSPLGLSKADVIALGSSYKSYMAHPLLHLTRSDFCASCHRWLCQAFHPALMYLYAPLILAGLSANALYSHCRYSLSLVVILGSILMECSSFPHLKHTWGYLSFVGFVASFWFFLLEEMIWGTNPLHPGCHLSSCPLERCHHTLRGCRPVCSWLPLVHHTPFQKCTLLDL